MSFKKNILGFFFRRFFLKVLFAFGFLYFLLHVALGSGPFQRRVLDELKNVLAEYGIKLDIESIEFSALRPRIYLNRVTLSTTPKAPLKLEAPIRIDKIKIEFQPLALVSRTILIDEVLFFNPKFSIPHFDPFYQQIDRLIKAQGKLPTLDNSKAKFSVTLRKVGVVDANFFVGLDEQNLLLKSRSFTGAIELGRKKQATVTLDVNHLELDRGKQHFTFTKIALDTDLSDNSLRMNRLLIEGEGLSVELFGSLTPDLKKAPYIERGQFSYQVKLPLRLLALVPDVKLPKMLGTVELSGTLNGVGTHLGGEGKVSYTGVEVAGYQIGSGSFSSVMKDQQITLSNVRLQYSGGEVSSNGLTLELKDRFPIQGNIETKGVALEKILESVKSPDAPLRMSMVGKGKVKGNLKAPFQISIEAEQAIKEFYVLNENKKGITEENKVLDIRNASLQATLIFTAERMGFHGVVRALDSEATADGFVGFNDTASVRVSGTGISLTRLQKIADVSIGGKANVVAGLISDKGKIRIDGEFTTTEAEIADLRLGKVKGRVNFSDLLLVFERLEMEAQKVVEGSGFLDFKPEHTHYRFNVKGSQVTTDELFKVFSKLKLSFTPPKGGDVLDTKCLIQGGGELQGGISVEAEGRARGFEFMDEFWQSAQLSILYRPDNLFIRRGMLFKKSGGVDVTGRFGPTKDQWARFRLHDLRVEELNWIGKTPLRGILNGEFTLYEEIGKFPPIANGKVSGHHLQYRERALPDLNAQMRVDANHAGFTVTTLGKEAELQYEGSRQDVKIGKMNFIGREVDLLPYVELYLSQDLSSLNDLTATGSLSLSGNWGNWKGLSGEGKIDRLRLGLKSNPMISQSPLIFSMERGRLHLDKFILEGKEGRIAAEYTIDSDKKISAKVDAKLDLQYFQTLIPGLDYAAGPTTIQARLFGPMDNFEASGKIRVQEGTVRFKGTNDDIRGIQGQIGVTGDKLLLESFKGFVGYGTLEVGGEVIHDRFSRFSPRLKIKTDRAGLNFQEAFSTTVSGDFTLRGDELPYHVAGTCRMLESKLIKFDVEEKKSVGLEEGPVLTFDISCEARDKLMVVTDVMNGELKGNFKVVGNTNKLGLLGSSEVMSGTIIFGEVKFPITASNIRFESEESILPRFNITGRAIVRETKTLVPQDYEVTLQVFGTGKDFKVRLSSTPSLSEPDITSLLVLGTTTRRNEQKLEGGYLDFGSAISNQIPFSAKIQKELGVDIKIGSQTFKETTEAGSGTPTTIMTTAPQVQIQKDLGKKTRVSYSNTLQTTSVTRTLKIEQSLSDSITVNGTAVDKARESQATKSYGVDIRYRFLFD